MKHRRLTRLCRLAEFGGANLAGPDVDRYRDGVTDAPYVSVRGEALLEVEPEIARLAVTVTARDRSREGALNKLAARGERLLRDLHGLGDAVERIETAAIRVDVFYKDARSREKIDGYGARVTHTVTLCDFAALGDLVAALSDDETVEVAGPWWALRPDADVYRQVRTAAVTEAVERARQYAAALGTQVTGVLHVADVGLLGDAGPPPQMLAAGPAARAMAAGAPGETAVLRIEPVRQVVRAAVEARFTLAPVALDSL